MALAEEEIRALLEREKRAWDEGDVGMLLSIFHPDAVWMWPQTHGSMDPLDWDVTVGRFDRARWEKGWARILAGDVVRNQRDIHRIEISPEQDGAVAVVDVDTEWTTPTGGSVRWAGRAVKYYAKADGAWKLIAHTGL